MTSVLEIKNLHVEIDGKEILKGLFRTFNTIVRFHEKIVL